MFREKITALALTLGLMFVLAMTSLSVAEPYERVGGVSGTLNSIGSDTLNNLMTMWAEGFRTVYPNVNIQIEGKGSSTAPPALIEGTAQLGPMSREMKATELDKFEARFGYTPISVNVAIDALAIYVHKDNPIETLTLRQIDSMFSSTYKQGGTPIVTWGDLGLTGEWKNRPVSLYGRNSASGTYGMFKKAALKKGDFKNTVKEQPGSSSVVQSIGNDLGGIGYSGIGYRTSSVKVVRIEDAEPTLEASLNGEYPLARFLYVYVNKTPNKPLDKLTLEFLKFVLSEEGQQVVEKDGYYSMPKSLIPAVLGGLE